MLPGVIVVRSGCYCIFPNFRAFFESVIRHNRGENEFRWKCIFLPDNVAFFVNYVVTSALIGTALELMR